ncbi:UNVERIFIED_CONTAM: hypothetical protein GTU68_010987 [Idotea baltica]|nr:hypothetical protein [Idotea baltica]
MHDFKSVRLRVLNLLARREHCHSELYTKLSSYNIPDELLRQVIDVLDKENLLSEPRYVDLVIRSRVNKGYGPLWIRSSLLNKQISSKLIEQGLQEANICWEEALYALWLKKFNAKQPSELKAYTKQTRFFLARGYPQSMISQLLNVQYADNG